MLSEESLVRKPRPTPPNEATAYRIVRKRVSSLKPSPENLKLYKPTDSADREQYKLGESIRANGLREPLVVTSDGYIVSGHRRHAELLRIGQVFAPCRVLPVRRDSMSTDQYIALLRDHNRQRYKNVAEQVREELVDINPAEAKDELRKLRNRSVYAPECNAVEMLEIEGAKERHAISSQKNQHVTRVQQVVFHDRKDYWPLSVRGVHYALLNYQFLRNVPRGIEYKNDAQSYQSTSDLLTRLRLTGKIPWEALDDGTRPLTSFRPFVDARHFVRQEVTNLFAGYWRDLLQTQPNHVEVVVEKNTVYHMALRVTKPLQVPTSSGRGFNSIDPWYDLYQRYRQSGKRRLIVIVLSDFDPEGQMIPHVGGRTLRDDFGIERLDIVSAAITREQIDQHRLPPQNFAKESSSNFDWFVGRTGATNVYELEALDPAVMLSELEQTLHGVLDMDLFNLEAEREQDEAAYLQAARKTAAEALKGLAD